MLDMGGRRDEGEITRQMPLVGGVMAMAVGAQPLFAAEAIVIASPRVVLQDLMGRRKLWGAGDRVSRRRDDQGADH